MLFLFVPGSNWGFQELILLTIPKIKVPPPCLSPPTLRTQGLALSCVPVTVAGDGHWGFMVGQEGRKGGWGREVKRVRGGVGVE